MKKFILSMLVIFGSFFANEQITHAASPSLYIDGVYQSGLQTKTINNTTLVPFRAIANEIGVEVVWNQASNSITLTHPYRAGVAKHVIGSKAMSLTVNGKTTNKTLTTNSFVESGVTYVPLRLFEVFDAEVYWQAASNRIDIYSYELQMNQYAAFASLAYNELDRFEYTSTKNKTTAGLKNVLEVRKNSTGGFAGELEKVKKNLWMYTDKTIVDLGKPGYFNLHDWIVYDQHTDSVTDLNVSVFENLRTNQIVIAFRGSSSANDWFANAESITHNKNSQALKAYPYFQKIYAEKAINKGANITIVGHSLGGYLTQAVAAYFPGNYKNAVTFNAFGTDNKNGSIKTVTNYRISSDIVSAAQDHYGRVLAYNIRAFPNVGGAPLAHGMFNFFGYFYQPNTKYWLQLDKAGEMPYNNSITTSTLKNNAYNW